MSDLEFFKNEAKKFLKDWQTQSQTVESDGLITYHYDWKFYDVGDLFFYYELDDKDEQDIKLARAQHWIAKMVGFKKWDELIHATKPELELAELLLKNFKDSQDIQAWENELFTAKLLKMNAQETLEMARDYFTFTDANRIANLPIGKIITLNEKERADVIKEFDDEHNPEGVLRDHSTVMCAGCKKTFKMNEAKVIKKLDDNQTMVVCKDFPNCKTTYLQFKVLTPTIIYGNARIKELKNGLRMFPTFNMDTKVKCIHCDSEFLYKEATVYIDPVDRSPYIECKNYPKCNGSIIDMMPVE